MDALGFLFLVSIISISYLGKIAEWAKDEALKTAKQAIADAEERETLRYWAMITERGDQVSDVMGRNVVVPGGKRAKLLQKVFVSDDKNGTISYSGKRCYEKEYNDTVEELIRRYPKAIYGHYVKMHCSMWKKDPSWRAEAEQVKSLLEKYLAIQPHIMTLDGYYGQILMHMGIDPASTESFTRGKDSKTYLIVNP